METRPVKIVRVLARMNVGGPAIHAVFLTQRLNAARFRSTLVTGVVGQSEGDMLYFAQQRGVIPFILPELGREISWWSDLRSIWKLYRLFVHERPDIVHTHTSKAGVVGRVAAILARVPIIIHTFHGHVFHDYFGPLKTKLFIWIERCLARLTTKIVTISQAQLVELSDRYRIAPRDKFCVIPLGLDLAPYLTQRREQELQGASRNGSEAVIGLVGRLVPVKNPEMAVRVLQRLMQKGESERPIRLMIVGDGELRLGLQEWVRKAGLEEKVIFTGWQRELASLYGKLDLVILTSLNEGTPVALLEAMAAGLPFVATRVGGVLDLTVGAEQVVCGSNGQPRFSLFSNGAVAEANDVEGFAAAVQYLLKDPLTMRRMGSEGRKFTTERYSLERLLRDTEKLYLDCLNSAVSPVKGVPCII